MKKNLILLTLVALLFTLSSCDKSTEPKNDTEYLNLSTNDFWDYDVFAVDAAGNVNEDVITTKTIHLGESVTIDKRLAYPLLDNTLSESELFTHISADNDGIFLYLNEINLNDYLTDPSITTNIPILIPGWIKVMDFNKNEWESFFFELVNQVIEQDTVSGKVQITGKKQSQKEVVYQGNTYTADVVTLTFDLSANVKSTTGNTDRSAKSDIIYTFIEGIGIYSIEQKANEILGIIEGRKEVLTNHGILGTL